MADATCPACGHEFVVEDANSPTPWPSQRRSILLMLLLSVVTAGLYGPIWFLRRRDWLNSLNSKAKLSKGPAWIVIVLWIGVLVVGVALTDAVTGVTQESWVLDALLYSGAIILSLQGFRVRHIVDDHLKEAQAPMAGAPMLEAERHAEKSLSNLGTFFFNIFYLQYVINKRVVAKL